MKTPTQEAREQAAIKRLRRPLHTHDQVTVSASKVECRTLVTVRADDLAALLAAYDAALEGLRPFADVAGPIKGEDGRPTYLDALMKSGGDTEELAVTTIFDTGGRGAVLWADDFRRARQIRSEAGVG